MVEFVGDQGLQARPSLEALHCVLEQDTLSTGTGLTQETLSVKNVDWDNKHHIKQKQLIFHEIMRFWYFLHYV